jgi:CheY-like chemotaxis protein
MRIEQGQTTDLPLPPLPEREAAASDLRVLIADDSAVTRRVMSALISTIAPGADLVEAATGADTCEELRRNVFDVAFVDFHMPDMSGARAVSLARRVGADPFVVVMGDSPEDATDRMLRTIDAYEFVQKPLEERELRQILATVRRMREATRVMMRG